MYQTVFLTVATTISNWILVEAAQRQSGDKTFKYAEKCNKYPIMNRTARSSASKAGSLLLLVVSVSLLRIRPISKTSGYKLM